MANAPKLIAVLSKLKAGTRVAEVAEDLEKELEESSESTVKILGESLRDVGEVAQNAITSVAVDVNEVQQPLSSLPGFNQAEPVTTAIITTGIVTVSAVKAIGRLFGR